MSVKRPDHHESPDRFALNDKVGVVGRINASRQFGDNISRDVER